jgi:DNA polymerase III delta prime subunit
MREITEYYKNSGNIHHFYILEGGRNSLRSNVVDFLETDFDFTIHANPLFNEFEFDRMLVDDVRPLIDRVIIKTVEGQKKVFLIHCNEITREAQNALLKIVEEPIGNTYFFFTIPKTDNLLPTVISRAILLKSSIADLSDSENENAVFPKLIEIQKMKMSERMKLVEKITTDLKSEKITKTDLQNFLRGLILDLKNEIEAGDFDGENKKVQKQIKTLKTLQKMDDYLGDIGSSTKMLLEHAILSI